MITPDLTLNLYYPSSPLLAAFLGRAKEPLSTWKTLGFYDLFLATYRISTENKITIRVTFQSTCSFLLSLLGSNTEWQKFIVIAQF